MTKTLLKIKQIEPVSKVMVQLNALIRVSSRGFFVCLFGEGTHARSDVAEASGMAPKKKSC